MNDSVFNLNDTSNFNKKKLTQTFINNVKNIMCLSDFEMSTKGLTAEKKVPRLCKQH